MARKLQFTLAQLMIAVVVIGYFCIFRELAVLLGIFLIAVLFVAPIPLGMWLVCRACFGKDATRLFPGPPLRAGGAGSTPPADSLPR